jgi:hypothetical protein
LPFNDAAFAVAIVGGFQEAKSALRVDADHFADRLSFVLLNAALHSPNVVLQAPPGALESVVDGKIHIGIAIVLRRGAGDVDLSAIRQSKPEIDLVKPFAMVATRCFEHDTAGGNASVSLLETRNVRRDRLTKPLDRRRPLEINFNRRFHCSSLQQSLQCEALQALKIRANGLLKHGYDYRTDQSITMI